VLLLCLLHGIVRAEGVRCRDLGIRIGTLAPGPHNAISDVAGVRVGHVTLNAVPVALLFLVTVSLATEKTSPARPLADASGNRLSFQDRLGLLGLRSSPPGSKKS